MRQWVVCLAAIATLAASGSTAPQKKQPAYDSQPSWTWQQVVQGAADNPKTVSHRPFSKEFVRDETNYGSKYDSENQFPNENDYEYDDYGDEHFRNDDYIYFDGDIDEVENPEQFQLKDEHANRRVLDFLYHTFAQPVLQPNQPAQPSLLGEVFRTIDNHINKDFTSLASLIAQGSATSNPISGLPPAQAYGTPVATSIAAGPTPDDFLVTDDLGNQHLVSVDDIVQSLSVLDERSLVDLILAPEGAAPDPSLSIQLPPGNQLNRAPDRALVDQPATQTASAPLNSFQLPAPAPAPLPVAVTPSSPGPLSGGVPLPGGVQLLPGIGGGVPLPGGVQLLGVVGDGVPQFVGGLPFPITQGNFPTIQDPTSDVVILPAQLTNAIRNAAATQGGEVFRPVRHTGPVNSPTSDDEESFLITDEQGNVQIITMNDILSSLSNLDEETLTSLVQDTAEAQQTTFNSTPSNDLINIPGSTPISTTASPPAVPLIQTTTPPPPPPPKPEDKTVISSGAGTHVSTDQNGNIYITPDPDKPFTLDIQNIIRLAEQAEQAEQGQTKEDKASEFSGAVVNQLPSTKPSTPAPTPDRGNQILAYLAGVENFLPNPILPGPIRPEEPKQPVQPQVPDFRTALLETLRLHSQPQQQLHAQPQQQTTPAPATPGIGAQLSGLLSRIVTQARTAVGAQPVNPVTEPQDEVIQLVIREQFEDGGEETYGTINVPLPQSIHGSKNSRRKIKRQGNGNSGNNIGAQRRQDTVQDWTHGLPKSVVEAIKKEMNAVAPQLDPSKAMQSAQSSTQHLLTQHYQKTSEKSDANIVRSDTNVLAQERDSHFMVTHDSDDFDDSDEDTNDFIVSQPAPRPVHVSQPAPAPVHSPQPVQYGPPQTIYESQPHGHQQLETYHGKVPLFDLFLLADFNKAHKLGSDSDHSFGAPLIGDPAYFVDTRAQHHY